MQNSLHKGPNSKYFYEGRQRADTNSSATKSINIGKFQSLAVLTVAIMVGHLMYAGFDEEECDFMKQKKVAWQKTAMFVVFVLCVGFFVSPTAHAYTFYIGLLPCKRFG